jgi:2-iminoacetate synthase ThiH
MRGATKTGFISVSHQDGSHGDDLPKLQSFFPKARHPLRAAAVSAGEQRHSGEDAAHAALDALRTIAVSRIYLDNFDHITAYWVGLGLKLAQVAQVALTSQPW